MKQGVVRPIESSPPYYPVLEYELSKIEKKKKKTHTNSRRRLLKRFHGIFSRVSRKSSRIFVSVSAPSATHTSPIKTKNGRISLSVVKFCGRSLLYRLYAIVITPVLSSEAYSETSIYPSPKPEADIRPNKSFIGLVSD